MSCLCVFQKGLVNSSFRISPSYSKIKVQFAKQTYSNHKDSLVIWILSHFRSGYDLFKVPFMECLKSIYS